MLDFAENYNFEILNEIQSMHWHSYQVTILVQITWYRNPHADPLDDDSKTLMKYNFYVSNDKAHDNYFVQYFLDSHWADLQGCREVLKKHIIWLDGCSIQFKSMIPWYYVSHYPEITDGCVCL
jgi:hypothetical protein